MKLYHFLFAMYLTFGSLALLSANIKKPFTIKLSKGKYPKAIVEGKQFFEINIVMTYIWVALFYISAVLAILPYSEEIGERVILMSIFSIIPQLIGIPINIFLPKKLMGVIKTNERLKFETAKDLLESMPMGFDKDKAKGVSSVIQFNLSGVEKIIGYLTIKELKCSFNYGESKSATTTIICDSKLWLDISNGDIDGDKAYLEKKYKIDGDVSILLELNNIFSPDEEEEKKANTSTRPTTTTEFKYKEFSANKIKKIYVVDGGKRGKSFSKSTLMAKKFCEGAKSVGAEIEYVFLKDKDLKDCVGCYNCWTKKPGTCIYKDDMTEMREKLRKADLVVYVSPLYIFSVTGLMKTFLDRMLPNMKPYMLLKDGMTMHPHRYGDDNEQGMIVFSAGGFPEVEGNFDGVKGIFRNMSHHYEKSSLMAEFYLPAAELIAQPIYKKRRIMVEENCFNAGVDSVTKGSISKKYMDNIQEIGISQKTFGKQADMFWEMIEGKEAFLKVVPKL